jgi:hypothetical protein
MNDVIVLNHLVPAEFNILNPGPDRSLHRYWWLRSLCITLIRIVAVLKLRLEPLDC